MPVDSSYYDWMPINKQLFMGCGNSPDAYLGRFTVDNMATGIFKDDNKSVEIWLK